MSSNKRSRSSAGSAVSAFRPYTRRVPVSKNVKRYVKNCMERVSEHKYITNSVSVTPGAAGTSIPAGLYNILNGTGDSGRVGNVIHVKSLHQRFSFSGTVHDVVRLILVKDKQCNGALANPVDVLETASILGCYNTNNVVGHGGDRFVIISDQTFTVQPAFSGELTFVEKNKMYTKSVHADVFYSASTGAVTDLVSTTFTWICISSGASTVLNGRMQVEYTDN